MEQQKHRLNIYINSSILGVIFYILSSKIYCIQVFIYLKKSDPGRLNIATCFEDLILWKLIKK